MKDRFDLESDITALYSTAEDLKCVADMMYDSDIIYTADLQHTVLHGIAEVLNAKVEKAMDTLCQVYKLNQYCTDPEALELRERLRSIIEEEENND